MTRKTLLKMLALSIVLATFFTISFTQLARADRGERTSRSLINALPPVGIVSGQTLHVTFLNTGADPFEIVPCVFNERGEDVHEGTAMTLLPGQMSSFDMSRNEVVERAGSRIQVRVVAHVNRGDLKNLVVTGEVIEEETGRSSLFVPGSRVGFDPQPDPPSSPN